VPVQVGSPIVPLAGAPFAGSILRLIDTGSALWKRR
jgi:hypothetical protein